MTVAKNIELKEPFQNLGAELLKTVATKTNDIAGDGTTTATILTRAIFSEGCRSVAAGMNPMDLKRGIDAAVERVVQNLKTMTKKIESKEEIAQVRLNARCSILIRAVELAFLPSLSRSLALSLLCY